MQKIRIVLADDHPLVRKGLYLGLTEDPVMDVVAQAEDGLAALAAVNEHKPDIVILDIDMPNLSGMNVAEELQRGKRDTRVIFLTLHADEDMLKNALSLGAKGYVLKESALQEIIAAVYAVYGGTTFISSSLTSRLLQEDERNKKRLAESPLRNLTLTELKIIRLISHGLTSKEIADKLSIHYRTVENHRTNMCRKLDVDGASALLRFALNNRGAFDPLRGGE
jgi:DNA-binding NarL/FixJ family response regulator